MIKQELNEELIKISLVSFGDTKRLEKMFEKADKGQDITIAFLGGSITQGCNATEYEKCYMELTSKWFREKFKNASIKTINAGVGATGSLIGVHRAQKQVLDYNPDLVFVDAAVNDNENPYCRVSYESEIRKILSSASKPAVIEVFMTLTGGDNQQESEIEIGNNYNLPMISFRNTAVMLVNKYNLKWEDLLTDEVHPNDYGHFVIKELLTDYIEKAYEKWTAEGKKTSEITDNTLEKPCVFGDRYIKGEILSSDEITPEINEGFEALPEGFQVFKNAWQYKGNGTGKLSFNVKCTNVILLYKKLVSEDAGKMKVTLDNNEPVILDTYFKDGWGDWTVTEILLDGSEEKEHKIEIETIKEEKQSEITILGIMIS